MEKKIKIYLASGWFTPNTLAILDILEEQLSNRPDVVLYSPRRDGVMLPPNQKHDTSLREKIFHDNLEHILGADLVLANINSQVDSYNDPGTIYEVGYAMSKSVPVVGFVESMDNIEERFFSIKDGFEHIIQGYNELHKYLDHYHHIHRIKILAPKNKVLFVGAGNNEIDNKLVSYIAESGSSVRWVNETHEQIYSKIDEIFENVEYMIAVIDDRKTIVSWMIGQAFARGIPVVTYSDFNYGINVMLLASVLTHIRGAEELQAFLQKVKREGLESIPKFDISQMDSM